MRNLSLLLILLLGSVCLPACQSQPVYTPPPDWKYADLRLLDPADDVSPSQDLIALYIRRLGEDIEIRLDLLDFSTPVECDLDLRIYTYSEKESTYIHIPAMGEISAQDWNGKPIPEVQPRVARDTFLDTVVVSLNRSSLLHRGLPYWVQASSSDPNTHLNRDQIGPVRSDASPPQQAQVLFTFWDTFSATTPAQALRLWDGAHSGPGRSRFGLRHLLNAVKGSQVPVFLLDLKTPQALSTLDFMGVLPELQELADLRLAILPEVAWYDIPVQGIPSLPDAYRFNLPSTHFLYSAEIPDQLEGYYQVLFLYAHNMGPPHTPFQPYRWQAYTVIHIPEYEAATGSYQPTADGPSLGLRQDLIQYAYNNYRDQGGDHQEGSFFMLGGKLAGTAWGDPACVSPTLRYLTAHPWMRFLTADDLLGMRPSRGTTTGAGIDQPVSDLHNKIQTALFNAPANPITGQAWQTYLSLLTPAAPELTQLRAGYFGIIGHLLTAAHWADRPGSGSDCTADLDWDGEAECILASPDFIATFEPSGGYIVAAFARRADGVHQIIAPYAQFVVGLGDPSTWDPALGSEADPGLVPGGFVDGASDWTPQVQDGQITFTRADGSLSKTFSLTSTGLRVDYTSASSITTQISVGLDPWRRFSTGWGQAYQESASPGSWVWALELGPQVTITTSGALTARTFNASRPYLASAEDPNFDYPAGHYLPFPLARVEINAQGNFFIQVDCH